MIPLELELVEPLGRLGARPGATVVTGMQIDSRRVGEGDLFVAIGAGEQFAGEALARGAAAVLVPDDAHAALATIAGAVRSRSRASIVAITGATGKTTTKDILAALCSPRLRTVASEGNFNNELGVPLTLCRIEPETELCIVEMGMRGLGQIAWLASFTRPDIGLITNIAPVHLELVGTVEKVAEAKAELLAGIVPGGSAVVPDEPLLDPYLTRQDITIRRFAEVTEPGRFPVGDRIVTLRTSFGARHQLQNTLAALTVCDLLGLAIPDGELTVTFTALREEVIELADDVLLINDCYNANPISLRAALDHLAELAGERRRIAVLGGMAELGDAEAGYHREIGALLRAGGVSELVAVGALARGYRAGTSDLPVHEVESPQEAVETVRRLLRPGDVVLVKGSRSVGLEAIAANLRP